MSEPIRPSAKISLAAAFTTFTSLTGLARLVQPKLWFLECMLLCAVVMVVGHLLRLALRGRGGWLNTVVVGAQLVCGVLVYIAITVPGSAPLGCLPSPGSLHAIGALFTDGTNAIASAVPPAEPVPGITAILCLVGLGLALLIDALAVTFRRAVLTGLPVLATVLVPATRLPNGPGAWFAFIVGAAGYLTLLNTEGQAKLQRWGQLNTAPANQGAAADKNEGPGKAGAHQPLAARIATTSVIAALILPVFVPSFSGLLKSGSNSGGSTGGTYTLSTDVDLRNSLTTTSAVAMLNYTTSATDPENQYLGMLDLDTFDGNSWTASEPKPADLSGPPAAGPGKNGPIPGLTGQGVAQTQVLTKIDVIGPFAFTAIPTPYATTAVNGVANHLTNPPSTTSPAPLGYSTDDPTGSQQGLQYQSNSTEVDPTNTQLVDSPPVDRTTFKQFLQLPSDIPAQAIAVAQQVTASQTTPYGKAVALQNYFYQNFTYSLSVPSGDGDSAVVQFLNSKEGFCQQFAATMAMMARYLGIPAVVEVGFTHGTKQPNGTYTVTTHDAHAWPMLYFAGYGWLRFEPTPSISASGRGSEPSWAPAPTTTSKPSTQSSTAPGSTAVPKTQPSKCGTIVHGRSVSSASCNSKQTATTVAVPFASWGPFGSIPREFQRLFLTGGYALILLKLALLVLFVAYCFPAYARISRRLKRRILVRKLNRLLARAAAQGGSAQGLDGGQVEGKPGSGGQGGSLDRLNRSLFAQATEAVWAELRENAGDLGYTWAESDTPRQATARLSREARLDEPADAAVRRITVLAEHAWYGPESVPDPGELQGMSADLDLVRTGLSANAERSRRLRTALMPASSLAKLRTRRDRISGGTYRLFGRIRIGRKR